MFREHHGELVRLALLLVGDLPILVGDLPTAEDVVQDVYASLHARWTQIAASEAILSYVRDGLSRGVSTCCRESSRTSTSLGPEPRLVTGRLDGRARAPRTVRD